jgi:hypothetical protein
VLGSAARDAVAADQILEVAGLSALELDLHTLDLHLGLVQVVNVLEHICRQSCTDALVRVITVKQRERVGLVRAVGFDGQVWENEANRSDATAMT